MTTTADTTVTAPDATDEQPNTGKLADRAANLGEAVKTSRQFMAQPMSLAEAWKKSGEIVPDRIPARSDLLGGLWLASNITDRLMLFAVIGGLSALTGLALWCVQRPTRRVGLYVLLLALLVVTSVSAGC